MLRLISDENFNGEIIRGLNRRQPDLELVRVQDIGLAGADDAAILAWAAAAGRILLTHDRATVPKYAFDRVKAGEKMPGVFVVNSQVAVGQAIDDVLLFVLGSKDCEWEGQVLFL